MTPRSGITDGPCAASRAISRRQARCASRKDGQSKRDAPPVKCCRLRDGACARSSKCCEWISSISGRLKGAAASLRRVASLPLKVALSRLVHDLKKVAEFWDKIAGRIKVIEIMSNRA